MIDFVFALESDIGKELTGLGPSGPGFWKLGLNALLNNVVQTMLVAAVAIATIILIIGGIKWAMSSGDKDAAAKAQKTITAAIIGLVIVFLAWAIVGLVKNILGVTGSSTGSTGGGGGTPSSCLATCKTTSCHGFDSFCFGDCRCQCNSETWKPDVERMWSLDNPWCDASGNRQFACRGGTRVADRHGALTGTDRKCPGD